MSDHLIIMAFAWTIEALIGWPDWQFKRIKHPVVWIGAIISALEMRLNRPHHQHIIRYAFGAVTSLLVIAIPAVAALSVSMALPSGWTGLGIQALAASSLLASRSLYNHVRDVEKPLMSGDIAKARTAVSMIVGRDTASLDDSGIAKAAIESLAENTSDGVTAPLFWGVCLGLPGIAAYKAINTLDSMIGHKSERYVAFGGFAARLDDVVNYVPARLSGALFALASWKAASARAMLRDARKHQSPNAGWPEAAMAGALGVQLGGPRDYAGGAKPSTHAWLNETGRKPTAKDLGAALKLYGRALGLLAVVLISLTVLGRE